MLVGGYEKIKYVFTGGPNKNTRDREIRDKSFDLESL